MAIILRSDVALQNPAPNSFLPPSLGVEGVRHRWHAEVLTGAVGQPVSVIPDLTGVNNLTSPIGSVRVGSSGGRRTIDLSADDGQSLNRILSGTVTSEPTSAFTLAALVYWELAAGSAYGIVSTTTNTSTQAISLNPNENQIAAYAGGPILYSPKSTQVGWHTAVISYNGSGQESLSLDGSAVTIGEAHSAGLAPVSQFGIQGRPANKIRFIDVAFIDRALNASEHALVHANLATQIPA